MLCPHCLQQTELTEVDDPDRGRSLRCPNPACADYPIPLLYAEEYAAHPPLPVSIVGLSGHGKTVFIESLLQEVHQLGGRWADSGFYFTWLDEAQMRGAYKRIRDLRDGRLPKATRTVFQQPQVLRLSHIPRIGGSQLVIFDTGGEAFLDSATLADAGRYVKNSAAVVWLLSLKPGDPYGSPDDVNQMMSVYLQAMSRMGGRTQDQTLVLVLTKGDELLARPDLPESARKALLAPNYSPAGPIWGVLDAASADLEKWLRSEKCGYHNLVNLVRSRFRAVRYCVVSAQGAPAEGDALQFGMMPRAVMAPLLWLWRLDRAPAWVDRGGERTLFLDLPGAVEQAAGATVSLEERVYRVGGPLNVRHPVSIVGAGAGKTVLEVAGPGYGIGIATAGKVTLKGVTVRRAGGVPGDVIRVLQGDLDLSDLIVTGGTSGTVDGRPVKGQGVLVARQSRLTATGVQVRGNHGSGVLVIDQAQARVDGCTLEGNGDAGVFVRTAGAVAIARSVCRGNQTGVWVEAAAAASVEGNSCEGNGGCGVVLSGAVGAGAVVRANQCAGNARDGIQLRGQAAPVVSGNTCTQNRRNGIAATDQSAGAVRENVCSGNARNGVRVADDAAPEVDGNTCEGNAECGLLYEDRGAGPARRNTARDNRGDGLRLEGDGRPELEDNEAGSNDGYGVAIAGPRSPVAFDPKRNRLVGNKKGPVLDLRAKKSSGWFGGR